MSRGPMPPGAKPRTRPWPRLKLSTMRNGWLPKGWISPAWNARDADDIVEIKLVIAANVDRGAQEFRIAANAGEILLEFGA